MDRPTCVTCGADAPETKTNYTLISRSGWRLSRRTIRGGAVVAEWRCPACWKKHKPAVTRLAEALGLRWRGTTEGMQ
jgi:hypothetical protein